MTVKPVLCVIPARGGSKGLPGKNIRPLAGLPLIAHSLRCAGMCAGIARTIVSTDSGEIAAVARANGADVPFLRPEELAGDTTPMLPVLQHALREMERIDGKRYGSVLLLDPTSPGRFPSDVEECVRRLDADPAADGVVGVSRPDFNPYWHCVVEREGYMAPLIPGADRFGRRQDVPAVYRINAS
ncbi:MAG: acylneuraminate cytidylyltransferase family protein, partial [Thermodesulfobacteriota bacterium]